MIEHFDGILKKCLQHGEDYRGSPPQGPPDEYPVLSEEDLAILQQTEHGEEREGRRGAAYSTIALAEGEGYKPIQIGMPTPDDLRDIHICGIDGSNQRVERSGFHFIMARASIIVFRYSGDGKKPYFYRKMRDASAVVWVDGNIFDRGNIPLHTRKPRDANALDLLGDIKNNKTGRPFMYQYKRGEQNKSPSSYALGLAVKLNQCLELLCIGDTPREVENTVCIKDGPLFSTSTSKRDTLSGLSQIAQWGDKQVLIACSKRVGESPLLLEALLAPNMGMKLREAWFSGGQILDKTLMGLSSDSILLPRILRPGERTPLMVAIPVARKGIAELDPRFTPLSCYYLSRNRPHTYVRMEIPSFKWRQNKAAVEKAIQIAAWQHDLGVSAPMVQLEADKQCSLSDERQILENHTAFALHQKQLNMLEDYDG